MREATDLALVEDSRDHGRHLLDQILVIDLSALLKDGFSLQIALYAEIADRDRLRCTQLLVDHNLKVITPGYPPVQTEGRQREAGREQGAGDAGKPTGTDALDHARANQSPDKNNAERNRAEGTDHHR